MIPAYVFPIFLILAIPLPMGMNELAVPTPLTPLFVFLKILRFLALPLISLFPLAYMSRLASAATEPEEAPAAEGEAVHSPATG